MPDELTLERIAEMRAALPFDDLVATDVGVMSKHHVGPVAGTYFHKNDMEGNIKATDKSKRFAAFFAASPAIVDVLTVALEKSRVDGWCDACGGTGTPVSGPPCMCGGSGLASDAVTYLRTQLFDAEEQSKRTRSAAQFTIDKLTTDYNTVNELLDRSIAEHKKDRFKVESLTAKLEEAQAEIARLNTCESCPRPSTVHACHAHAMDG